ncbi:hypothetical protein QG37_00307 [Candidozyma auris]|uniref:Uncharacterized protein n=1 Tax=Candidozyma auris TaxID=498019 RepID=A0A0L0P919_CANAR|nr:hypothetical protein QG37_00307 [[Candida] auris]
MYMRLLVLEDDVTLYIVHNSKGDQETKEKKKIKWQVRLVQSVQQP